MATWQHRSVVRACSATTLPSAQQQCRKTLPFAETTLHFAEQQGRTARSVEDETPNTRRNPNRNLEWWGDFSQLQTQNHGLNLYREIQRNSNSIKILI